jgi:hypothetical protein
MSALAEQVHTALRWDVSHARRSLRTASPDVQRSALVVEQARRRPRRVLCAWLEARLAGIEACAKYSTMSEEDQRARGAQPGNQNAAKDDDALLDAVLHLKCMTAEKNAWVKAATKAGSKLAPWVRCQLSKAAKE